MSTTNFIRNYFSTKGEADNIRRGHRSDVKKEQLAMKQPADPTRGQTPDGEQTQTSEFSLQAFFPYLARVFYTHVSGAVSQLYGEQFGMKRSEWRTMAILGQNPAMTASEIVAASSMDKVSVSRAITSLRKRGWLVESANRNDARSRLLKLSRSGRDVYTTLVPQMFELEQRLLADLSDEEVATLKSLMARVAFAAEKLGKRGF